MMLTTTEGIAVALPATDINTDQILPARFLKKPRQGGYQDYLFHDLRFGGDGNPRSDFVLNHPPQDKASILVAGSNFGCGSSREGAVYALVDFGFKCVIAESFGDIFSANCAKNRLLTARVTPADAQALLNHLQDRDACTITVDIAGQLIVAGPQQFDFQIEPYLKELIMTGVDDIDHTLTFIDAIESYEQSQGVR